MLISAYVSPMIIINLLRFVRSDWALVSRVAPGRRKHFCHLIPCGYDGEERFRSGDESDLTFNTANNYSIST